MTIDLSKLQALANDLAPEWEESFEQIVDDLRDEFVKLADAQLLTKESK